MSRTERQAQAEAAALDTYISGFLVGVALLTAEDLHVPDVTFLFALHSEALHIARGGGGGGSGGSGGSEGNNGNGNGSGSGSGGGGAAATPAAAASTLALLDSVRNDIALTAQTTLTPTLADFAVGADAYTNANNDNGDGGSISRDAAADAADDDDVVGFGDDDDNDDGGGDASKKNKCRSPHRLVLLELADIVADIERDRGILLRRLHARAAARAAATAADAATAVASATTTAAAAASVAATTADANADAATATDNGDNGDDDDDDDDDNDGDGDGDGNSDGGAMRAPLATSDAEKDTVATDTVAAVVAVDAADAVAAETACMLVGASVRSTRAAAAERAYTRVLHTRKLDATRADTDLRRCIVAGQAYTSPTRSTKYMLFADVKNYSKLKEEQTPLFFHQFLTISRGIVDAAPASRQPVHANTWGDALWLVFDDVFAAADYALNLLAHVEATDWTYIGLPEVGCASALVTTFICGSLLCCSVGGATSLMTLICVLRTLPAHSKSHDQYATLHTAY
jgi:hypothetical protein